MGDQRAPIGEDFYIEGSKCLQVGQCGFNEYVRSAHTNISTERGERGERGERREGREEGRGQKEGR